MIVTALIVAALIAAAFFLPARFMNVLWGNGSATPAASVAAVPAAAPIAKPVRAAVMKPQPAKTIPASTATAAAPKAGGDLVANTFQTIFAGPNGPSIEQPPPAAKPGTTPATAMSGPGPTPAGGKGVVTRLVDTVVIHADPKTGAVEMPAATPADNASLQTSAAPAATPAQPATPVEAAAPAEAAPIPLAPPPSLAARPTPPASSIVADAKPAGAGAAKPAAAAKPEPAASELAIVGGKGVTVRSGPATARGALFTLAAGKKLTVSGKEHGWLHVTDAEGRSGWVYSGLVEVTKG